jgi:AraC-like DNA-binding protein/quercetin dioxygenase-like cupin family protein
MYRPQAGQASHFLGEVVPAAAPGRMAELVRPSYFTPMADSQTRALHQDFLPKSEAHAFVWKYSHRSGGRRPRHFHGEPEINLVVRGSATFGVGERTMHVRQGELIAFPSGQDHVLLDSSADLYLYAVGLDVDFSSQVLGGEPPLPVHVKLGAELESVLAKAADIVDRPRCEQAAAELWQRVHWLSRRAAGTESRSAHVLTRRALQLLNGAPQLGVAQIAKELRAHPSEVSRHFHRDMGMTLVRYRTRCRLLRFIALAGSGQEQLIAAAGAAGFGSYSQFHRAFQAELGCAPGQFFTAGVREQMQLAYVG